MKEILKIDSFNKDELNMLREHFEKNRIKTIYNNIKSEDKIQIEYDEKLIELNKKFELRIKLIRNKYFRQLLNIINIKDDVNKKIDEYNSAAEKYNKYSFIFDKFVYLDKIDSIDFKDTLRMLLINYIGVYNFDNVFELSKEEMIELKDYKQINNITEYNITRLMGAFIPEDAKEHVIEALKSKIYGIKLDEMKKCRNFIIICPEIIQEFCVEHFNKFKECDIRDIFELYTIIFNLVLVHEIGHGVYYKDDFEKEKRANYFASLTFDGVFDKIIKVKTDIQGGAYENPILLTNDIDIKEIKLKIYNI